MQEVLSQGCQCEDFINAKRCLLKSEDELKTLIFFHFPLIFSASLREAKKGKQGIHCPVLYTQSEYYNAEEIIAYIEN